MIVVDTNVIVYLWVSCDMTARSEALVRKDPDWHAPRLWVSELRNALARLVRSRGLDPRAARRIAAAAEAAMSGREHDVRTAEVLDLAARSGRSAYDCEFVALAERLGVPLVTADGRLISAFPSIAVPLG